MLWTAECEKIISNSIDLFLGGQVCQEEFGCQEDGISLRQPVLQSTSKSMSFLF